MVVSEKSTRIYCGNQTVYSFAERSEADFNKENGGFDRENGINIETINSMGEECKVKENRPRVLPVHRRLAGE
jgi:hypothetical protein